MKIEFNDIKPFVRFIRYLPLTKASKFEPSYPYDVRMFYATDGIGTIVADGVKYRMQKGSVIFINSGIEYHLESPESQITYLAVNFDYTFANHNKEIPIRPVISSEFDSRQLLENITFTDASAFNKVLYFEQLPIIEKQLVSMLKEYSVRLSIYKLKLSSMMADVLVKCFRQTTIHNSLNDGNEIANKIITYIGLNFHKKLTNKEIAKEFNYHPNYISSLVKDYTGLPLHQYIKDIRVTKATDMLLIHNKSVSEVATDCGFYNSGHFIRCFKDIIGITPQQYRNYYL